MITRVHIQNYKAIRDISLELTPVHVLIGPNDSGKTSILNALAALSRSTDHPLQQAFIGSWEGRELVWHGDPEGVIRLSAELATADNGLKYTLACRFPGTGRQVAIQDETISGGRELKLRALGSGASRVQRVCIGNEPVPEETQRTCRLVFAALSGVHYYRWNPRFLALPVAPDSKRRFRMDSTGFGLALCLDDILGFDRQLFGMLEQRFCSIFPEIHSIKLMPQMAYRSPSDDPEQVPTFQRSDGKGLYFELRGSQQLVPASQASDGVLLVLGYLAVLHIPKPPRLILVEEPENGIHPKRLKEVLGILRELVTEQSESQIVLTTHSPYAVDLFAPEEVTLCTKTADGSVTLRRMADSETVREQLSVFTLGEIWTAEGDQVLAEDRLPSPS